MMRQERLAFLLVPVGIAWIFAHALREAAAGEGAADAIDGSPVALHSLSPRYLGGAPAGFSGGFGEEACDACHFTYDVNFPGGTLELTGLPERYAPGEIYPLSITLTRPGTMAGGFQLSARFREGGEAAGTLGAPEGEEARVGLASNDRLSYLVQIEAGSAPAAPDTLRWNFLWTAPVEAGPVVFHLAGNAADGDGGTAGDYIYTLAREVEAR